MSSEQSKIGSRAERYSRANSKADSTTKPKSSKNRKDITKRSLLLYSAIALIIFILGSMIGYVVGGRNALEVFNINTWLHMFNLIFG